MVRKIFSAVNTPQLPDSNSESLKLQALGNYETVLILDHCVGNLQRHLLMCIPGSNFNISNFCSPLTRSDHPWGAVYPCENSVQPHSSKFPDTFIPGRLYASTHPFPTILPLQ